MSNRNQRVMVQPINIIFKHLQSKTKVQIWLYDNVDTRMEGTIVGFDEFMNVVLDAAAEISLKGKSERKELGRILLKGDNITLIQPISA